MNGIQIALIAIAICGALFVAYALRRGREQEAEATTPEDSVSYGVSWFDFSPTRRRPFDRCWPGTDAPRRSRSI